jgi:hypothetical protein
MEEDRSCKAINRHNENSPVIYGGVDFKQTFLSPVRDIMRIAQSFMAG